jgi:hypothetical protein
MQIFYEGVKGLMLEKLIINSIKNRIVNHDKIKKRKLQRWLEKQKDKMLKVKMFGKTRYYLSVWFGEWMLYTFNYSFYAKKAAEPSIQQPSNIIYLNSYR